MAAAELNNKSMIDSGKLKGGAIVLILIAALALFDGYGHPSGTSPVTGAVVMSETDVAPVAEAAPVARATINVANGWNLISMYPLVFSSSASTDCSNLYGTGFTYEAGGYSQVYFENREGKISAPGYSDSVNEYQGMWLYNYGEACTISSTVNPADHDVALPEGWNLLAVQPSWVGKSMDDLTGGSCIFGGGLSFFNSGYYNPSIPVSTADKFQSDKVGQGFWVWVSDACSFKAESIESRVAKVLSELELYSQSYRDNRKAFADAVRYVMVALENSWLSKKDRLLVEENLVFLLEESYYGSGKEGLARLVQSIAKGQYFHLNIDTGKGTVNVLYLTAFPENAKKASRQIKEFLPALQQYSTMKFPENFIVYDGFGPFNGGKVVAIGFLPGPPRTQYVGHELAHSIQFYTPGWLVEGWAEYLQIRAQEDVSQKLGLKEKRETFDFESGQKLVEEGLWDFNQEIEGFNTLGANQMKDFSPAKKYVTQDIWMSEHAAPFIFLRDLHKIIGPAAMKELALRLSEREKMIRSLAESVSKGNYAVYEVVKDCKFLEAVAEVAKEYAPSMVDAATDHVVKNGIGQLPDCSLIAAP